MRAHREEIARIAAEILMDMVKGIAPSDPVKLVKPDLVERGSVRTLPA